MQLFIAKTLNHQQILTMLSLETVAMSDVELGTDICNAIKHDTQSH